MTREDAIEILAVIKDECCGGKVWKTAMDMAIEALKENESLAKSVIEASELLRKKRPHGEWILNKDGNYECSECGIAWKDMPTKDAKPVFKACSWCGADMRKEGGEK